MNAHLSTVERADKNPREVIAMKSALLLGATGLVGRELLRQLLDDESLSRVVVVARRPTGMRHPKLDERVFDLAAMSEHAELFAVDEIFCALGTTIKAAGSQERFRYVDHVLPLLAARLGVERGVRHYLIVSAMGANSRSRIFYNRVKGEVENDLRSLDFPTLTIARPSLLLGDRSEYRRGERIAANLGWLMPPAYKAIQAAEVARALIVSSHDDTPGVRVIESRKLRQMAEGR